MDPVTVTIADPFELAGYQRARCYRLIGDVRNLVDEADVDLIFERADSEQMPKVLEHLEAARTALEAIHGI